ncbi:MAG: ribosomal protein S18-alanine N-acetyltransferase [Thermofilum sp.]
MEPTIRRFRLKDLKRVLEIEEKSFGVDAYDRLTFLYLYRSCGDLFLVAEMSGSVIGYSVTCVEGSGGDSVGHVHSIAVDPQFRKKGVGRALMEETFRMLRERGVKSVVLEVSIANEAGISFWKSLGFSPVGIRKRFYLDGTDAIIMRKEI